MAGPVVSLPEVVTPSVVEDELVWTVGTENAGVTGATVGSPALDRSVLACAISA